MKTKGLVLDGIAASEAIDTSGEELNIEGVDISTLATTGVLNYEHRKDSDAGASFNDIIGKILYAKKILKKEDCEDERQTKYWNKIKLPFIYIIAELMDAEGHPGAVAAAANLRYHKNRKIPNVARFSIEGSTLKRDGNKLLKSVARRVALTIKPCNISCETDVLVDPQEIPSSEETGEISKKERLFVSPDSQLLGGGDIDIEDYELPQKSLVKALTAGGGDVAPSAMVGMSALVEEDRGNQKLKKAFVKFMSEWDGKGNVKELLKNVLPTASDEFLNHFEQIAEDYRVRKTSLSKAEGNPVNFGGYSVIPGQLRLLSRTGDPGKDAPILGLDGGFVYFSHPDTQETHKISRAYEGEAYQILREPIRRKIVQDRVGDQHVSSLNMFPEQRALAKDFDVRNPTSHKEHNGGIVTVSRSLQPHEVGGFDGIISDRLRDLDDSTRQVIFYNISKAVFGLDKFVPVVALYSNPQDGVPELLTSHEQGAIHPEFDDFNGASVISNNHSFAEHLHNLGVSGDLDKLAVMDVFLGMGGRNDLQYLMTDDGRILLVNNNLCLEDNQSQIPSYIYRFCQLNNRSFDKKKLVDLPLHPKAVDFIKNLDAGKLISLLSKMGVPSDMVAKVAFSVSTAKKMVEIRPTYHALMIWRRDA